MSTLETKEKDLKLFEEAISWKRKRKNLFMALTPKKF